jgi:hypothetical protein
LYFLSVLAVEHGIIIDWAIGAPGHGKDIVDGINAIDKEFLRSKMCMIGTPEASIGTREWLLTPWWKAHQRALLKRLSGFVLTHRA